MAPYLQKIVFPHLGFLQCCRQNFSTQSYNLELLLVSLELLLVLLELLVALLELLLALCLT